MLTTGTRVKTTLKLNARSTDPVDGAVNLADSFRLIKRGTLGTVVMVRDNFATVKFDGITTRQEFRTDCLKTVTS